MNHEGKEKKQKEKVSFSRRGEKITIKSYYSLFLDKEKRKGQGGI